MQPAYCICGHDALSLSFVLLFGSRDRCWHHRDTSDSGLDGVKGRVDYSFLASELPTWSQFLFGVELKTTLKARSSSHLEAVGQLLDRSPHVFQHQPPGRSRLFGVTAGADALQVLCIQRNRVYAHTTDMRFSLLEQSEGMVWLVLLLLAPLTAHTFQLTLPPALPGQFAEVTNMVLADFSAGAKTSVSACSGVRGNQVWQAFWPVRDMRVAVKTGSEQQISAEVSCQVLLGYCASAAEHICEQHRWHCFTLFNGAMHMHQQTQPNMSAEFILVCSPDIIRLNKLASSQFGWTTSLLAVFEPFVT